MNPTAQEFCTIHRPCEKGKAFALQFPSMSEVWDKCPRIDWLLWMYARTGKPVDDRALRLFAVWCARSVSHLLIDPRSLAAIDTAERYANGLATRGELEAWASSSSEAAEAASSEAASSEAASSEAAQCAQFRELIPNPFKTQEDQG